MKQSNERKAGQNPLRRICSLFIALLLLLQMYPATMSFASDAEDATVQPMSNKWVATPYHNEDGDLIPGLEETTKNKLDWTSTTEHMPTVVTVENDSLIMNNGSISREFHLPSVGETDFYTKSYRNEYIEVELMKEDALPDMYLALYDKPYNQIYSERNILVDPEYYFVGGSAGSSGRQIASLGLSEETVEEKEEMDISVATLGTSAIAAPFGLGQPNTFIFDGYEVFNECEEPFAWSPDAVYGDPAAEAWPPKGMRVEFNFIAPSTFPVAYQNIKIKLIYEMYDNLAAMKKRVEIINDSTNIVTIGRLAPEVLNGNANMDDLMYIETSFTGGHDGTIPFHNGLNCECKTEKPASAFYGLRDIQHTCYDVGPAYTLPDNLGGNKFVSFETYELVHSTYWFEQQSRERLGMYRKLLPWVTDNPLTFHNTGALTKNIIDTIAESGFEMIIQSYGSPEVGGSGSMLSRDPVALNKYKDLVDYAHSKDVAIGIYQAQYQLGKYNQGNEYGKNPNGQWGTWCMATAAWDDYWDNFKYFVEYTGMDCVEIDGTYPNSFCTNGEHHHNVDREYDPNPDNGESAADIGGTSKYAFHNGYHDSKVKQWENAVRMLSAEFRDMGVYIKVPAWYYVSGGNKCGIGYEEAAWSQPRQEQLIYSRQLIHNASYVRTMSMSWTHVPFSNYHGGGSGAAFQPFKNNKEDYNWVLAQTMGNGLTSDFRGNAIYDDETLPIMQKWVSMYNKYRGIVNSDMVHTSQANYGYNNPDANRSRTLKMDSLYHVNANNPGEKGLIWVYNQSDQPRTETITVPMYYTGLTNLQYPPVPVPGSMGRNVKSYGTYPPNYDWLPEVKDDYTWPAPTGTSVGSASFLQEGIEGKVLNIDSNGNALLEVTLEPMSFTYFTIYDESETPDIKVDISKVNGLAQESSNENSVTLKWNDNVTIVVTENGQVVENLNAKPDHYKIYRDSVFVGDAYTNSYTDTELAEKNIYSYEVSAVYNNIEGPKSNSLLVATQVDKEKPTILSVNALSKNEIAIQFSETVEEASATKVDNYKIAEGNKVFSAKLEAPSMVILTVDKLDWSRGYQISVKDIIDRSAAKNKLDPVTLPLQLGRLRQFDCNTVDGGILKESYSGKNGTVQLVQAVPSPFGKALSFTGNNSYANLGSEILKGQSEYTLSFWINPLTLGDQVLVSQGQEARGSYDFTVALKGGRVDFQTSSADGSVRAAIAANIPITAGQWNLINVVRNKDSFVIYINGEVAGSTEVVGLGTLDNKDDMLVGAQKNLAGGEQTLHYKGLIDEIEVLSYSLESESAKMSYYQSPQVFKPLLALARSYNAMYYTEESYRFLAQAADKLEALMNSRSVSYVTPVYEAVTRLRKAIDSLERLPEYASLVASYPMNEGEGASVYEQLSGQPAIMTKGDYTRYGTPFGKGIFFSDSIKNYVTLPDPQVGTSYTIEGWIKPLPKNTTGLGGNFVDEYSIAGKFPILSDEGGNLTLSMENGKLILDLAGGGTAQITASSEIAYDTFNYSGGTEKRQAWNHFAVTRAGDVFTLYLNGASVGTVTQSDVGSLSGQLLLGTNPSKDKFYIGVMDEVQIYDNAITSSNIQSIVNNLPFDKASATNLAFGKSVSSDPGATDRNDLTNNRLFRMAGADTPFTARANDVDKLTFTFDLGAEYEIDATSFTYFSRAYGTTGVNEARIYRRHREAVIQVASDSLFTQNVHNLYNSDTTNRFGQGIGTDTTYFSTDLGYDVVLDTPVSGRYVRIINGPYANFGGIVENYINVNELEIYGRDTTSATSNLSAQVSDLKALDKTPYTPESVAALNTAISEADALLLGTPSLTDVQKMSDKLKAAEKALRFIDNSEPTVMDVYPKGQDVSVNTDAVTLLFNKDVTYDSNHSLTLTVNGEVYTAAVGDVSVAGARVDIPIASFKKDGKSISLVAEKTYTLVLPTGAFKNSSGIPTSTAHSASFTTTLAPASWKIIVSAKEGGTLLENSSGNYPANQAVSLKAKANTGYKFAGWSLIGVGRIIDTEASDTTFFVGDGNATITANFVKEGSPATTYQLLVTAAKGGKVVNNPSGKYENGKAISLTAEADSGYTFTGWSLVGSGKIAQVDLASTVFTMGAGNAAISATFRKNDIIIPPKPPVVDGGNNNSNSGGGGSGGSARPDSQAATAKAPSASAPLNRTQALKDLEKQLKNMTNNKVTLTLTNVSTITKADIDALVEKAKASGASLRLQLDTREGGVIRSRMYLSEEIFSKLSAQINATVLTKGTKLEAIKALFAKYFSNTIVPVELAHKDSFGTLVTIALKADTSKLDMKGLTVYSYDATKNQYSKIANDKVKVDANGFIHITVEQGGFILLTDKPLQKK